MKELSHYISSIMDFLLCNLRLWINLTKESTSTCLSRKHCTLGHGEGVSSWYAFNFMDTIVLGTYASKSLFVLVVHAYWSCLILGGLGTVLTPWSSWVPLAVIESFKLGHVSLKGLCWLQMWFCGLWHGRFLSIFSQAKQLSYGQIWSMIVGGASTLLLILAR